MIVLVAKSGTWDHWIVVASTTDILAIYKNAVALKLSSVSTTERKLNAVANANQTALEIGSARSLYNLQGRLQSVRIWNRPLSAEEIQQLYAEPWAGLKPISDSEEGADKE